jgi:AcrR family transcriptional regulator
MSNAEIIARVPASTGVKKAGSRRPAVPRRRTQAERSDETRGRVLEAAVDVLRRRGYAGFRTDEVARVAKVSRGAQQYHFPTKDSLVLATAEQLLRRGLERGRARAQAASAQEDVVEAIIQDCMDFFLGRDFGIVLDLVLSSTKDRGLRDKVYGYTRESRLGVEAAWLTVLCDRGLPRDKATKVLWLTISIVRGLAMRALWQRDEKFFRVLLDEWKSILAGHLKEIAKGTR